jgi:acetyl esterase/lipase
MPFGYLVSVLIAAVCTGAAVASPHADRTRRVSLAYLLGFVVNEAPIVLLGYVVVATVVAGIEGDLLTPVGVVAAALAACVTGGLIILVLRQIASAPDVAARFRSCLADEGADMPLEIPVTARWRGVLLPVPVRPRSVVRVRNLPYSDERRQRLDILHRPGVVGAPVLVHLHGGAFRGGRKYREARSLLHEFAAHGWMTVTADYRLAPHVESGDQIDDARAVVGWVREHAERFGGDPDLVVVAGSSAGGYLAGHVGLTDPNVAAVVLFYAFYGAPEAEMAPLVEVAAASAIERPPFIVVHGDRDTVVVVDDARALVARLRSLGDRAVVGVELRDAQHGFDLCRSARFLAVVRGVGVALEESLAARDGS